MTTAKHYTLPLILSLLVCTQITWGMNNKNAENQDKSSIERKKKAKASFKLLEKTVLNNQKIFNAAQRCKIIQEVNALKPCKDLGTYDYLSLRTLKYMLGFGCAGAATTSAVEYAIHKSVSLSTPALGFAAGAVQGLAASRLNPHRIRPSQFKLTSKEEIEFVNE